ncbi:50S ribosomal protein L9 [Aquicella siphonis]|uniref:Large ribosomal subunit protein bL9 n=1 Tax=Aquicella siphonis TaxID=254247 RepID=A0A5E4PJI4_9COXI|nr:50S ribosomal protein L9 [Aquicella siphonis]VVC76573.1 50S ribosomal protein L9 [Aquicella siphonis]
MEVILLEKMRNLGALGEKVKVKSGYARNFLIPQGKAVYATKDNLAKFELRRAELEKLAAERMKDATARQQSLAALPTIVITVKAGEEGKLFGSIGTRDIADAIMKAGVKVEKREVYLPEGAIRLVGEYDIAVDLGSDVTATVKVSVVAEG